MDESGRFKKRYAISVIFPVFNEEENIEQTVRDASKFLSVHEAIKDYEIILVDDGSRDNTAEIAKKMLSEIPCTKIVTHRKNAGYGMALNSGIRETKYPLVFFMDADGQFHISDIDKLIPYIEDYDVIAGYRFRRKDNCCRVILGKLYSRMVSLLFGISLRDINCGFKLFKKKAFKFHDMYDSSGGVFYAEIFLKGKGCKIKEIPVEHFPRMRGKQTGANIKTIFNAVIDLIKLKYSKTGNKKI